MSKNLEPLGYQRIALEAALPKDHCRSLRRLSTVPILLGAWAAQGGIRSALVSPDQVVPQTVISGVGACSILAGLLLYRGSLRTARIVAFLSSFVLSAFLFQTLARLAAMPRELVWAMLRFRPFAVLGDAILPVCFFALLAWTYMALSDPALPPKWAEVEGEARPRRRRAWLGLALGVLYMAPMWNVASHLRHDQVQRATLEARKRVGSGYGFYVTRFDQHGPRDQQVRASVVAYNAHEVRDVSVSWEEPALRALQP